MAEQLVHHPDKARPDALFPAVREYQALASKHGIGDIFQDNGDKLLQTLLILNLQCIGSREGNDAKDENGNEYELKTVNILLTQSFSTHHHLNPTILWRNIACGVRWYFSIYRGVELAEIFRLEPAQVERDYFSKWEAKWRSSKRDINNPKIPVKYVRQAGRLVFTQGPDGRAEVCRPRCSTADGKARQRSLVNNGQT